MKHDSPKEDIIRRLLNIPSARRGQISEQYYSRTDAQGKTRRTGPYYVWQRWVRGKKYSVRIPPSAVAAARKDLERGKAVEALLEDLWRVMEQRAVDNADDRKKKPWHTTPPVVGKSPSS